MGARLVGLMFFPTLLAASGCTATGDSTADPVDLVDPFIGTGGKYFGVGSGFPGASVPFGMAKPGPDTTKESGALEFHHCSGYHYDDGFINGFSQVHIHGTGAPDYGALLLMPTVGFGPEKTKESVFRSSFSKETEKASPGYYSVMLDDQKVRVELTATTHCAYHRYTFPAETTDGFVIIDLSHAISGCQVTAAQVEVDFDASEVAGWLVYQGSLTGRSGGFRLFFSARLNQPLQDWTIWRDGELLPLEAAATGADVGTAVRVNTKSPVEIQVGLSYVDQAGARKNLQAELSGRSFDTVHQEARERWSQALDTIEIKGGSREQRVIFYTALYHTMLHPTLFEDSDGRYTGFDKLIHTAEGYRYYTDFSLWDTFRTVHSLFMLISPGRQQDLVISLLKMYEQGGHLPRWPAASGDSNSMIGTPADVVISESYIKGIWGFDVELAFQAIKANATTEQASGGREGIARYLSLGYVPADEFDGATALTLEFANADAAISGFAEALGYQGDSRDFAARAQSYRNVWDPETQFMRGRKADGSWAEPFDPLDWASPYYVEGDAWQYLWLVPQDPGGLIEIFGGSDTMADKLEAFFSTPEPKDDLSEYLPKRYYWHGNEPDLHAAYLFNPAGRPERTQYWARHILSTCYGTAPDGLAGNDDLGTLSAWYVFSASGFYPIAGQDLYHLGSPIFQRIAFRLGEAGVFEVIARGVSEENLYIQSARLNGRLLEVPWFRHADIQGGGTLELVMGSAPSGWGH